MNTTLEQLSTELSMVERALKAEIAERMRREKQLTAQYRVSRILAEASSLEEAAAQILPAVCESVEWDVGDIWVIDRQANALRCLTIWHSPTIEISAFETITR